MFLLRKISESFPANCLEFFMIIKLTNTIQIPLHLDYQDFIKISNLNTGLNQNDTLSVTGII